MKEKLKKIKFINNLHKFIKGRIESIDFFRDRKFFLKNFIFSKNTLRKNEYNIMLSIHQLEKGMTSSNLRPFGASKIENIIEIINGCPEIININNYVYNYAMSILSKYKDIYEKNNWINENEYVKVNKFLNGKEFNTINAGATEIKKNDIKNAYDIDLYKFLSSRHSVRNFSSKKITDSDIDSVVNMAILSPSACNRQMCKVYYIKNDDAKEYVKKVAQGLSLFDTSNISFFIITFDVNANNFVGERNQGYFNAGLFSMNFVNALHSLGIGSCFIQFGNSFKAEKKIKQKLKITDSERIAVIIAAGYYDEVSKITFSTRKSKDDIYRER